MAIDSFSTAELLGMIDALDRPAAPLLNMFFPNQIEFESEEVYFDKIDPAKRLAPFVSPMVAGKAVRSRGYKTRNFKPAYVKPKHAIDPSQGLKRRAGERLGGASTPSDRIRFAVIDNLKIEDEQITRREEWMASQMLLTGSCTVQGDDYPAEVIDLGRDAANTIVLAGASRWGQAGISPYANLVTWASQVQLKSGVHPKIVIVDPLAGALLQKDADLRAVMNLFKGADGGFSFLPIANGGQGEELVPLARTPQFEIYQYSNPYTLDDGTAANMMPANTVIMGHPTLSEGVRCYGAIKDLGAMVPMSRFPKQWNEDDPSVGMTMTQSAPLPILGRPDATLAATVN